MTRRHIDQHDATSLRAMLECVDSDAGWGANARDTAGPGGHRSGGCTGTTGRRCGEAALPGVRKPAAQAHGPDPGREEPP